MSGQKVKKPVRLSGKRAAREILLLSTVASVSPEGKERLSSLLSGEVDWKHLMNLAVLHDIAPLLFRNLQANELNGLVPASHLHRLDQIYHQTLYRNVIFSDELSRVLTAFNQRGIPVISLKGTALAEMLYDNPALRTTSDMDILVRLDDLSRAGSLLAELGYEQAASLSRQSHPFHGAPYHRQATLPVFIELHWDLEDEKLINAPKHEIWGRARTLHLQVGDTLMLSPEDTLLFAIVQLCKSFDQLKALSDIAEMLRKYRDVLDWRYILESARSWGIAAGAYYSLKLAADLLEAPAPAGVIRELKPLAWRRALIGFLTDRDSFISRIKWNKLRDETLVLLRGLMMRNIRTTVLVLKKYRGPNKRGGKLRTAFWIALVFVTILGLKTVRAVSFGAVSPVQRKLRN